MMVLFAIWNERCVCFSMSERFRMSIRTEIIKSKVIVNKDDKFNELKSVGSADLYNAVLGSVPSVASELKSFVKCALKNLSLVKSTVKWDKPCDVVHILSHLVEVGIVTLTQENKYRQATDSNSEYLISSTTRYHLAK